MKADLSTEYVMLSLGYPQLVSHPSVSKLPSEFDLIVPVSSRSIWRGIVLPGDVIQGSMVPSDNILNRKKGLT